MNENDITEARAIAAILELPNLHKGARALAELRDWTNRNSDGWPYWNKPNRASTKLQGALAHMRNVHYQGGEVVDIKDSELARLFTPVKSFLTRQGVDHAEVFKP